MKLFRNTNACLLVLLAFVLAGCGSSGSAARPQPGVDQDSEAATPTGASAAGTGSAATATGTAIGRPGVQAATEPGRGASGEWLGGPLGTLVIYFDYDRSTIRPEYAETLRAHGAWLAANPGGKLQLEGHADERGTPEYNLALGARRAHAVAQALMALGAADGQWTAVSFGEEKPMTEGANEMAWSQNRRVELIYE